MTLVPAHARAVGEIRASFVASGGRTSVDELFETGGLRLRFPNAPGGLEGVIVNTGGGVAGGDSASYDFLASEGARVTLTTQSAEKIYRAQAEAAEINVSLRAREGAMLEWLPQETIMFAGAKLKRRLDVDLAEDAALTLVEPIVFGRLAMGELSIEGSLRDRWRVRRNQQLVFAEEFRIEGEIGETLDRPAVGRKGRATALMLHVAPGAEGMADPVREALRDAACECAVSAWNGMLVARFVSPAPEVQRLAIVLAMRALRGQDAPRVWT